MDLVELKELAVEAAMAAGSLVRERRGTELEVETKNGGKSLAAQVVTEVDRLAQEMIVDKLRPSCEAYDLALLGEESVDDRERLEKDFFWCIDPIDGTLPFIQGEPGFSVSIALVARDGSPQIGVVYDPVESICYAAVTGQGATRNGEAWTCNASPESPLTFYTGFSMQQDPRFGAVVEALQALHPAGVNVIQGGGAVLNACWCLEQAPGCTLKFPDLEDSGGSLWDYAATACLYQEVPRAVATDVFGEPLDLNRVDSTFMNHRGLVYASDALLAEGVMALIERITEVGE